MCVVLSKKLIKIKINICNKKYFTDKNQFFKKNDKII